MPIHPANASELAYEVGAIAREVGAEVVEGDLRYQSGSWQLGDVMVSDRMDELAGHNASFWRDAAACLRRFAGSRREPTRAAGFSGSPERS